MEGLAIAIQDMLGEIKGGPKKDAFGNTLHQAGHREEQRSLPGLSIISTAVTMNPGFYKAAMPGISGPTGAELKNNLAYRGPAPKGPTLG